MGFLKKDNPNKHTIERINTYESEKFDINILKYFYLAADSGT